MGIRRESKEKYYQNNTGPNFDEKAKQTYENFMNFKNEITNKTKKKFFESIFPASERYVSTIANYNPEEFLKMDRAETIFKRQELSDTRKAAHNSLISKVDSTKRLFSDIKNLFGKSSTRGEIAKYASELIMGDYITNERGK